MDMIVDTLPVLVYDEVVKVGLVRKDIEDGVFEKTETFPIEFHNLLFLFVLVSTLIS